MESFLNNHGAEDLKHQNPSMIVFGVGGAGCNAVNDMMSLGLKGVKYVVANTDAQSLASSPCESKIQLGNALTRGLGAGSNPEVGKRAAEESESKIRSVLENSDMVFITAGMGGGTGTGAAPVIARIAREMGILVVAVVTTPFQFEGSTRSRLAAKGLDELRTSTDTLIVISNQNLFSVSNETTTFEDAFRNADRVLYEGVRSISDLITVPGLINLDFADIKAVMYQMGVAMMGTGESDGEDRAIRAAESAISNPLLEHGSVRGARNVLINITGGRDMKLYEVDSAANWVREAVNNADANIIFGSAFSKDLEGKMRVSVVATGIEQGSRVHDQATKTEVEIDTSQKIESNDLSDSSFSKGFEHLSESKPVHQTKAESNLVKDEMPWNERVKFNANHEISLKKKKPSFFRRILAAFKVDGEGDIEDSLADVLSSGLPQDVSIDRVESFQSAKYDNTSDGRVRDKPDLLRRG